MKKILSLFILFSLFGVYASSYVAAEDYNTPRSNRSIHGPSDDIDSHECEKYPDRCPYYDPSLEQENAIKKAESYIEMSGFSKSGLIEQLKFEGFNDQDSEFAVHHLQINWNKQAEKKAESYIEMSGFSKSGLIEQLKFDGFTESEAEYGAKSVGYGNDEENKRANYNNTRSNKAGVQSDVEIDSYECEKYPDRCPDYKKEEEVQASEIDDCKWDPAKCKHEAEEAESKANYNNTRSNRSSITISDSEIEDCKWDPPKCRDELETRMMQEKIQIKTDGTVWCWGRVGSHCSPDVREERREILKERLKIEERQYQNIKKQFKPRVETLFQQLDEEEYDRISQRLAMLIEQNEDNGNTILLTAILALQGLLEESDF